MVPKDVGPHCANRSHPRCLRLPGNVNFRTKSPVTPTTIRRGGYPSGWGGRAKQKRLIGSIFYVETALLWTYRDWSRRYGEN